MAKQKKVVKERRIANPAKVAECRPIVLEWMAKTIGMPAAKEKLKGFSDWAIIKFAGKAEKGPYVLPAADNKGVNFRLLVESDEALRVAAEKSGVTKNSLLAEWIMRCDPAKLPVESRQFKERISFWFTDDVEAKINSLAASHGTTKNAIMETLIMRIPE